jgi:hypothetical protein
MAEDLSQNDGAPALDAAIQRLNQALGALEVKLAPRAALSAEEG